MQNFGLGFYTGNMVKNWVNVRKRSVAFLCMLTIGFAGPAMAQTEPSDPVPQPPPSVDDFSLPPGDNSPAPQPAPTGPVDESAPPVANTPAPQPRTNPVPRPALPPTRASANTETQPEAVAPPAQSDAGATADEAPSEELPTSPVEPPAQSNPEPADPLETDTGESPDQQTLLLGIGLAIILLGSFGFLLWRKRGQVDTIADEIATDPSLSEPIPEKKAETLVEETDPAPAAELAGSAKAVEPQVEDTSSGFVTTKVRESEAVVQSTPPPKPAKAISDRLNITFAAESASSTLMNAVVGYRLTIENRSEQDVGNLYVTGTMIQADKHLVETAASSQGQLLHEIGDLTAGGKEDASGEIRLPLAAFQPIDFQSQKLFVPLVLLRFDYVDSDGNAQMQAVNFLVGTEHQPPREKMAPFRLDQGPRNFKNVAHRPFQG